MAHRASFGCMSPLSQFSVLPYHLDPSTFNGRGYLLDHQQAHNDMLCTLPNFPPYWPDPEPLPRGGTPGQNLLDTDLNNPRTLPLWLHFNHTEHLTVMDLQLQYPNQVYPFW